MRKPLFVVLSFLLCISLVGPSESGEEKKDGPATKPWKITGELEEACNCDKACPCWFGSKPTHKNCGGGWVLFIEKGNYGDLSVDGFAVGRVQQSPDGQAMMESFGNWTFDYIYIDEKANEAQRVALKEIVLAVMPAGSPMVEVRFVPITRTIEGKEHHVMLGQYGSFSAHLIEGGLGGPAKIVNPPGADPIRSHYHQGTTTKLTYGDANQNWNTLDSNYMHTKFEVSSEDYAKYDAMIQQKMEEKKKKEQEQDKN